MPLGDITLSDSHQARDPGFRGQQVVVVVVRPLGLHMVADVEHLPLRIEQETEVHSLEVLFCFLTQVLETDHPAPGSYSGGFQFVGQASAPGACLLYQLAAFRWDILGDGVCFFVQQVLQFFCPYFSLSARLGYVAESNSVGQGTLQRLPGLREG